MDEPSTRYHSPAVRAFNAAAAEAPPISLREADLLAAACAETGLEDWGDSAFLPSLRILLAALESEAALNPFGRSVARSRTLNSLKNRLWAQAAYAAYPEIRQRRLADPLVIIGPHRSGTTRLHSMLATDARFRHLLTWEGMQPAPRLALPERGRASSYAETNSALARRGEIYPGAYLAHPMHADWPEEEMLLMNHAFAGFSPLGLYRVPSYYTWFLADAKRAAYRELADHLRLIEWAAGEPEGRPWVLKNPQHLLDLPTLLEVFPGARLVFIHRDPQKTVGSVLSLMWSYAVQHTDAPARGWIRDTWLDFCVQSARRSLEFRQGLRNAPLDVYYADMNRDWRGVIRRLYDFAGLEFDAGAEAGMATWLDNSAKEERQSHHRYALEDFGITASEVESLLGFQRRHYDIPYETARHAA